MKMKRFLAYVLTVFMMFAMLPSMVFAEEALTELGGKLALKGDLKVESTLSAEYKEVIPENITDNDVTFQWTKISVEDYEWLKENKEKGEDKSAELQYPDLGTKSEYKLTAEDEGFYLVLVITGKAESGLTGSIYAVSKEVIAPADAEEIIPEELEEIEEMPEEIPEIIEEEPEEVPIVEEIPEIDNSEEVIPEPEQNIEEEEELFPEALSEQYSSEPEEEPAPEEDPIPEEDPVYAAEAVFEEGIENLDFGTILPEESTFLTFEMKNTGNTVLNFIEISPEHFMVQDVEEPLFPGESVTLWVTPREGIGAGTYEDEITYLTEEGLEVKLTAKVVLAEEEPEDPENPDDEMTPVDEPTDPEEENPADEEIIPQDEEDPEDILPVDPEEDPEDILPEEPEEPEDPEEDPEEPEDPEDDPEEPEAEFVISEDEIAVDFGEIELGVDSVLPENITVSYFCPEGLEAFIKIKCSTDDFVITNEPAEDIALATGDGEFSFTVAPVDGLEAGEYETVIGIYLNGTEEENLIKEGTAAITVIETELDDPVVVNPLLSITAPEKISGIENGTALEEIVKLLPATVKIETAEGTLDAEAVWNTDEITYDPASAEAQNFNVKGEVVLPENVENVEGISLVVNVTVAVKASEVQKADPEKNSIVGMEGKYTTDSRISFKAVGAGMDNENPKNGDTRFVPESWKVVNSYSWEKAPYTASFGMAKPGKYNLAVTYRQERYNGTDWEDTEVRDTRNVEFTVAAGEATPTPTTAPTNTSTPTPTPKGAVNTGDENPIALLVGLLVAAGAAIAGVFVYRGKKK